MNHKNYLYLAYLVALKSPDPSTQNGALLIDKKGRAVIGSACNTFPPGVSNQAERLERPIKYQWVEHSERGSIYSTIRNGNGKRLSGATMVCPWASCAECARAIICCGIHKLVTHQQAYDRSPPHWKESIAVAFEMFNEAGIEIVWYNGVVGAPPILHSGDFWSP